MRTIISSLTVITTTLAILAFMLPGAAYGSPCIRNGENYCWKCYWKESESQYVCGEFDEDGYCDCDDLPGGGCAFNESDWCDYIDDQSCPDPPFCPMSMSPTQFDLDSLFVEDRHQAYPKVEARPDSEVKPQGKSLQNESVVRESPDRHDIETADKEEVAE